MARPLIAALAALTLAGGAEAHEFWIDPPAYVLPEGAPVVADLRVGEQFNGAARSLFPPQIRRFELGLGGDLDPVEGRPGDRPALNMPLAGQGLVTILHESSDSYLTYQAFDDFAAFARHKDFVAALEAHVARGLPQDRVTERYSRYAKSLVALGHGRGTDRAQGLRVEFVALANPYTDPLPEAAQGAARLMPVQILVEGAPRADAQIEIYDRAPDGRVQVLIRRSDSAGRAEIPVRAGHSYLLDHVVLVPVDPPDDRGAVWESLWGSLTFSLPE